VTFDLDTVVEVLRRGGVISCPTETLQGLLADALDHRAVARVVELKRRGAEPIALLAPSMDVVASLAAQPLSNEVRALAAEHWPGPLTLIIKARAHLPHALAPAGTVGVRIPGPSRALDVVRAFGGALTATSCNLSGHPPARTEAEARAYFEGLLDAVVPGDAPGGAPSTVLDVTTATPHIVRQGAVHLTL
jgi:L-threonylcarbamoyladenylate synthase